MRAPLGAGDDARQQVVGEDALGALLVAVDGKRDALVQEREVGLLAAAAELVGRHRLQELEQGAVLRARLTGGGEHLIVSDVELIAREGWRER